MSHSALPASSAVQLRAIFDGVPDSIFLIDPITSNIVFCNRTAHEGLGYRADEILGHSVLSLQKDVTGMPAWELIAGEIRKTNPYVFVGRHRRKDGHEVSVEVLTSTFQLAGRDWFLSSARDITLRVMQEAELLARDAHVRFALNEAADGLWDWSVTSGHVFVSPQLKRMLGYGPQELASSVDSWSANVHPDDQARVFLAMNQHLRGQRERFEAEYRLKNRNGHDVWVSDRGRVCERGTDGKPLRVVGMVRNITDQKTLELQLMALASHDSLTGLRNRRECEQHLATLLQTCNRLQVPLGLCVFDLDHFKKVNDLLGHPVGDRVLQRVARTVEGRVRASDGVFRWGGEEFVVLCPGVGGADLEVFAHLLRTEIAAINWQDEHGVGTTTASFGLATFPQDGGSVEALVLAADTALYRAKAAGRNQVFPATSPPVTR